MSSVRAQLQVLVTGTALLALPLSLGGLQAVMFSLPVAADGTADVYGAMDGLDDSPAQNARADAWEESLYDGRAGSVADRPTPRLRPRHTTRRRPAGEAGRPQLSRQRIDLVALAPKTSPPR